MKHEREAFTRGLSRVYHYDPVSNITLSRASAQVLRLHTIGLRDGSEGRESDWVGPGRGGRSKHLDASLSFNRDSKAKHVS